MGLDILGKPRGAVEAGLLVSSEAGPPLAGGSQKVKQPEILGCSRPRKSWGGKKKEKKCFRPRGEMSLLVSRVRGLKEPAHNGRQRVGESRDVPLKPLADQAAKAPTAQVRARCREGEHGYLLKVTHTLGCKRQARDG